MVRLASFSLLGVSAGLLSFTITAHAAITTTNCPLQGADFPPPLSLANNTLIQNASAAFLRLLDDYTSSENTSFGLLNMSANAVSINIFTAHDNESLFQYHSTPAFIQDGAYGVTQVNADTIYRLGSVSKLFTVYTFLIEAGDMAFNTPITKYVPELKTAVVQNATDEVSWDDITIGELASHMAGIGRDSTFGDISPDGLPLTEFGFPATPASDIPTCGATPDQAPCSRAEFFERFKQRHPVYATSTTPIYSNAAFQILSYALESITNKTFESMISEDMFDALSMSSTSLSTPNISLGVIPNDPATSWWSIDTGDEAAAGGIYSSSNDLAKAGRAILTSQLLPPPLTRRWLKPASHTSALTNSVGHPWEIIRLQYPPRIIDLYTKEGDLGQYAANFVLSPDHNFGFSVLAAGESSVDAANTLAELVVQSFMPAVEAASRAEAASAFSGTYTSSKMNSTITISTDDTGRLGLGVTQWISNGTNFFDAYGMLQGATADQTVSVRLYPNGLNAGNTGKITFRAVLELFPAIVDGGLANEACVTWTGVDGIVVGNVAIDDFLFVIDEETGSAVSVEPRVLRVVLERL